ncbi:hypothetical protein PI124_g18710 [Phytophthora idaei]|nr:hypothetical protein PI125_g22674 [Phytophthora idaei]KAG3129661.1 hypothetical protein PI126_g20862 [Phytophthora idaei]KAG3236278.1 hypothetical protein PI124_g18710 [Phytophthora idaei]
MKERSLFDASGGSIEWVAQFLKNHPIASEEWVDRSLETHFKFNMRVVIQEWVDCFLKECPAEVDVDKFMMEHPMPGASKEWVDEFLKSDSASAKRLHHFLQENPMSASQETIDCFLKNHPMPDASKEWVNRFLRRNHSESDVPHVFKEWVVIAISFLDKKAREVAIFEDGHMKQVVRVDIEAVMSAATKNAAKLSKEVFFLYPSEIRHDGHMVVFTSPNAEWLQKVERSNCTYYMPLWTVGELQAAATVVNPNVNAVAVRFELLGGVGAFQN